MTDHDLGHQLKMIGSGPLLSLGALVFGFLHLGVVFFFMLGSGFVKIGFSLLLLSFADAVGFGFQFQLFLRRLQISLQRSNRRVPRLGRANRWQKGQGRSTSGAIRCQPGLQSIELLITMPGQCGTHSRSTDPHNARANKLKPPCSKACDSVRRGHALIKFISCAVAAAAALLSSLLAVPSASMKTSATLGGAWPAAILEFLVDRPHESAHQRVARSLYDDLHLGQCFRDAVDFIKDTLLCMRCTE